MKRNYPYIIHIIARFPNTDEIWATHSYISTGENTGLYHTPKDTTPISYNEIKKIIRHYINQPYDVSIRTYAE